MKEEEAGMAEGVEQRVAEEGKMEVVRPAGKGEEEHDAGVVLAADRLGAGMLAAAGKLAGIGCSPGTAKHRRREGEKDRIRPNLASGAGFLHASHALISTNVNTTTTHPVPVPALSHTHSSDLRPISDSVHSPNNTNIPINHLETQLMMIISANWHKPAACHALADTPRGPGMGVVAAFSTSGSVDAPI